jgi:hypothetical protein
MRGQIINSGSPIPALHIAQIHVSAMRTLLLLVSTLAAAHAECVPSVTTAIGTKAPAAFCSGDLIFNEEFNVFDLSTWNHEKTAAGGGVSYIWSLGLRCDMYTPARTEGQGIPHCFKYLEANPPEDGTDPFSETLCFVAWTDFECSRLSPSYSTFSPCFCM